MKIGIIGSGNVAQTLARGLEGLGHSVRLGTRDIAKLKEFCAANPTIASGSTEDAARFGEIVIVAVKGNVAEKAVAPLARHLAGKIVIDTSNPLAEQPPQNGVLRFFTGPNDSLGERLQAVCPEARIVKAFNSVGAAHMIRPRFAERPTMFIAGNDAEAKAVVSDLLVECGWDAADMGSILSARAIEPLCQLWCIPGMLSNDWSHAFRLIH